MVRAILLVLVLIASVALVMANDVMTAETDIIVPQGEVRIEVPDYVFVGNITWGFLMQTDETLSHINNTGTVDVTVTPELADPEEDIFSYLYFKRIQSDPFRRIGNWSVNISKPSEFGGTKTQNFYMKLDMRNYEGEINESMIGHQAEIVFVALEQ